MPYKMSPEPPYASVEQTLKNKYAGTFQFPASDPGSHECVALVKKLCGAPQTSAWKRGVKVQGNGASISAGTAIATFNASGSYDSASSGNHAAIYIGQTSQGIVVYDQWAERPTRPEQPVHERLIKFSAGTTPDSNDGSTFQVIEHA